MKLFNLIFIILLIVVLAKKQAAQNPKSQVNAKAKSSTRKKKQNRNKSSYGWIGTFSIIAVGIGAKLVSEKLRQNSTANRSKQVEQIFEVFQGRFRSTDQAMTPQQMDDKKKWLMANKWKISLTKQEKNGLKTIVSTGKFLWIKDHSYSHYIFELELSDYYGQSKAQGLIASCDGNLFLIFQKNYKNKAKAGQRWDFDILIYEGKQQGDILTGKWYFKGYKNHPKYSGRWYLFDIWSIMDKIKLIIMKLEEYYYYRNYIQQLRAVVLVVL